MTLRHWLITVALVACSRSDAKKGSRTDGITRDFVVHPAIVAIDDADEIYAVSDPHGGYAALGTLLANNKLIANFSDDPARAAEATWTGGSAILVVVGDLIDKGQDSLGVIDLLRGLQVSAASKGGRVIVTLGNHEAEFFANPRNRKATSTGEDRTGIDVELAARGIDPLELASATDTGGRGRWLMDLPLGVRIKKWLFAHGGNTGGDSLAALDKRLQSALTTNGFGAMDITGKDSILEAQEWYGSPSSGTGRTYAKALGVKHIVFGHDPGAFGDHGHIVASDDGSLIKLDVMMGLHGKKATTGGLLLHLHTKGSDTAEVLDATGTGAPLF